MCALGFDVAAGLKICGHKGSKAPANLGGKIPRRCLERGLFTRQHGDILAFALPGHQRG